MRNALWLVMICGVLVSGCSGERAGLATPRTMSGVEQMRQAYDARDLLKIQSVINQQGKVFTAAGAEIDSIHATMFREGLFTGKYQIHNKYPKLSEPIAWKTEDVKVRDFLERHQNDEFAFFLRQECATNMICRSNILDDQSEAAINALAYYVKIMLEEGTYSPGLYYYSFQNLKSHWSHDNLKSAANRAINDHPKYAALNQKLVTRLQKFDEPAGKDMVEAQAEVMKQNEEFVRRLRQI